MRSSYSEDDVIFLLKDITGLVRPLPAEEREKMIQSGKHYSEMLPIEYVPTEEYMRVYRETLKIQAKPTALAVGILADRIIRKKGREIVLVSLARAGTPIGILLKRYIRMKYGSDLPHYSISIIRGRGIDDNAMRYLLERYEPEQLLFVDGWIGKGAIQNELKKAVSVYEGVSPDIAAVADPANMTELCGTHEDILIPSSCLNSTVSGLVSRTFLRDDIIGPKDFHGAVYYGELKDSDLSYDFINAVEKEFVVEPSAEGGRAVKEGRESAAELPAEKNFILETGIDEVKEIAGKFGIDDMNLIKPGIGEATRVLLRRIPWKVLIDERYKDAPELGHLVRLAGEKQVPIEYYPLRHYKCCGIIKKVSEF